MAVLTGGPGQRLTSLRGQFVVVNWRGKTIIKAWPRKVGPPRTPKERASREYFAMVAQAIKWMDPAAIEFAYDVSRGTSNLPRDFLTMELYQRLGYLALPNGLKLFTMVARQDVSQVLDALGYGEGSILVRGPEFWEALLPGDPGTVLTVDAEGRPVWAPASGGGGAPLRASIARATNTSSSATWPRMIPYDTALYQDAAVWDISQPTRLTIPAATEWIRFRSITRITDQNSSHSLFQSLALDGVSVTLPGAVGFNNSYPGSVGFNNRNGLFESAWISAAGIGYAEMRLNCFVPLSAGILEGSWVEMEWLPLG